MSKDEAVPASEPSATDDPVIANIRAMLDMEPRPPTWGEVRYLLAHIDTLRGYAKTGEEVEGVLIEADIDDAETTPAGVVRALLRRVEAAEGALREIARGKMPRDPGYHDADSDVFEQAQRAENDVCECRTRARAVLAGSGT